MNNLMILQKYLREGLSEIGNDDENMDYQMREKLKHVTLV